MQQKFDSFPDCGPLFLLEGGVFRFLFKGLDFRQESFREKERLIAEGPLKRFETADCTGLTASASGLRFLNAVALLLRCDFPRCFFSCFFHCLFYCLSGESGVGEGRRRDKAGNSDFQRLQVLFRRFEKISPELGCGCGAGEKFGIVLFQEKRFGTDSFGIAEASCGFVCVGKSQDQGPVSGEIRRIPQTFLRVDERAVPDQDFSERQIKFR